MRKIKKSRKFTLVYLALIISLAFIGLGYGIWGGDLNIRTSLMTGNIDPQISVSGFSKLKVHLSDDKQNISIYGEIFPYEYDEGLVSILDKGSIPVKLESFDPINSSEIVEIQSENRQSSRMVTRGEGQVIEDFYINILPLYGDEDMLYQDHSRRSTYNGEVHPILEEISQLESQIQDLKNEIEKLNIRQDHRFRYELKFVQAI